MYHQFISIFLLACLTLPLAACGSSMTKGSLSSPTTMNKSIPVDGSNRTYRIHIPARQDSGQPLPLIIALHGAFSSARKMEQLSGFSTLADKEKFVVVYPNGIGLLGFLRHWNAGFCCGRAMSANWNDIGFLLRLIEDIPEQFPVDRQRIYLVGMSNGGMLAHRFAAEYPDRIAAVTLVAAAVGARWSKEEEMQIIDPPTMPVPALIIHSRDDPTIPFEGGRSDNRKDVEYLGPDDAVRFWRKANHCEHLPATDTRWQVDGSDLTRWSDCMEGTEVALLALDQGGHAWPVDPVDGAETAWSFMSRFSRGFR